MTAFGNEHVIKLVQQPIPKPGNNEVLIAVAAAALNPIDAATLQGVAIGNIYRELVPHFPRTLGWDMAGTIIECGAQVKHWQPGDKVIAMVHNLAAEYGVQATHIVIPEALLATWPKGISATKAASLPLPGLTAYQAINALRLKPGETVLINGALGAVGSIAAQLAIAAGCNVVGVLHAKQNDTARTIGITTLIERGSDIEQAVRQRGIAIDAALDVVGGRVAAQTIAAVRDNGRYVTLIPHLAEGLPTPQRGIVQQNVLIVPDAVQLQQLSDMVDNGSLRLNPVQEWVFTDIRAAYRHLLNGTSHKQVLVMS